MVFLLPMPGGTVYSICKRIVACKQDAGVSIYRHAGRSSEEKGR
jgi:hypothetical protein